MLQQVVIFLNYLLISIIPSAVLATSSQEEACKGSGGTYTAAHGTTPDSCAAPGTPLFGTDGFISAIVNTLFFVAGAIAVIIIIIGGVSYITSTGDPSRVKRAKDTILYAVIGLVVVILAYAIVSYVTGALK